MCIPTKVICCTYPQGNRHIQHTPGSRHGGYTGSGLAAWLCWCAEPGICLDKFHVPGMFPFFVGDQGQSGECCYHFCYLWWGKLQCHLQTAWPVIGYFLGGHLCRARRVVDQVLSPGVHLITQLHLKSTPLQALRPGFGPRKEPIQLRVSPLTPWVESLKRSLRWFNLSKALLKSRKTKSTWSPSLSCLPRSSVSLMSCVSNERFSQKPWWSSYKILLLRYWVRFEATACSITPWYGDRSMNWNIKSYSHKRFTKQENKVHVMYSTCNSLI